VSLWHDPLAWLGHEDLWYLYVLLLLLSFLKYAAPPVPGDILMLASIFLVGLKGGSGWISACSITLGGTLGAFVAYEWGRRYGARLLRRGRTARLMDRVEGLLGRWGYWPLLANRFILYVRCVLFPAAGMLRMKPLPVALAAAGGNALFALFLVLLGHTAGKEWGRFASMYHVYQVWLGLFVFCLLGLTVGYLLYGAWRAKRAEDRAIREDERG
jgi:membrane protein DedA with SNARE-associated domain